MKNNDYIDEICSSLTKSGYSVIFRGFNALDRYIGLPALPFLWAETNADITVLARLIENLRFPGVEIADGAADTENGSCYFRCLEYENQKENIASFNLLSFAYDWQRSLFQDPRHVYPLIKTYRRKTTAKKPGDDNPPDFRSTETGPDRICGRYRIIMDAALILSRYDFSVDAFRYILARIKAAQNSAAENPPLPEIQRVFLCCLLVSPRPDRGLELLKQSLFLKELWPELACFDDVDHSKEYHPEGNVWNHTLQTFRHRKAGSGGVFDLRLSLGLLLHDAGKPVSPSFGSRRFDGHAELGAFAASRFLERLEFNPSMIQDIYYLVKNHMLPASLKRLPLTKTSEIMASPLFPTLMELYRCDESSSFKGLDGYYENSAAYQAYLKNAKNPYRSAAGKKMGKKDIAELIRRR